LTRLTVVSAKKLEKFLNHLGFIKISQKGSHAFYRHLDGRTTTIPHQKGQVLSRPLLRTILREIKIDVDMFNKILDEI